MNTFTDNDGEVYEAIVAATEPLPMIDLMSDLGQTICFYAGDAEKIVALILRAAEATA